MFHVEQLCENLVYPPSRYPKHRGEKQPKAYGDKSIVARPLAHLLHPINIDGVRAALNQGVRECLVPPRITHHRVKAVDGVALCLNRVPPINVDGVKAVVRFRDVQGVGLRAALRGLHNLAGGSQKDDRPEQ